MRLNLNDATVQIAGVSFLGYILVYVFNLCYLSLFGVITDVNFITFEIICYSFFVGGFIGLIIWASQEIRYEEKGKFVACFLFSIAFFLFFLFFFNGKEILLLFLMFLLLVLIFLIVTTDFLFSRNPLRYMVCVVLLLLISGTLGVYTAISKGYFYEFEDNGETYFLVRMKNEEKGIFVGYDKEHEVFNGVILPDVIDGKRLVKIEFRVRSVSEQLKLIGKSKQIKKEPS